MVPQTASKHPNMPLHLFVLESPLRKAFIEHVFAVKLPLQVTWHLKACFTCTYLRKDLREKIHKEAYVKKIRKRPYEPLSSHVRKRLYKTICL